MTTEGKSPYLYKILIFFTAFFLVSGTFSSCSTNIQKSNHLVASRPKLTTLPSSTSTSSTLPNSPFHQASWVIKENSLSGTQNWELTGPSTGISGYSNSVSAQVGTNVSLYVSTVASSFQVFAYRMGWYQGNRGRLIWQSGIINGVNQPTCPLINTTNTIECNWTPSLSVAITPTFIQGDYLFKLVSNLNQQSWIPLTIEDPSDLSAYLIQNSVTTWQAYNLYGGYDLYSGLKNGVRSYNFRSLAVSFDRPYQWPTPQVSEFVANELPLVALAEKLGLDVSYTTNVDLSENPSLLMGHKTLVSLGHDEYWSLAERTAVFNATQTGMNFLAFGANAIFRHIRFSNTALGNFRLEICYKTTPDPINAFDPEEATVNWPEPPFPRPSSQILGDQYSCNPVNAPMKITEPKSWIFAGSGFTGVVYLPNVIGSEYDHVVPGPNTPSNVEIIANSPLICRGIHDYADTTWLTTKGNGGVFDSGTSAWVGLLAAPCPSQGQLCPSKVLVQATTNLFMATGNGPAGIIHPSIGNY